MKISDYKIYIDVGSLTTKVYRYSNKLEHVANLSLNLKDGYSPEGGISEENKNKLFQFINSIKGKHPNIQIKTFATAIFRKMTKEAKTRFIDEFFINTGIYFNIVEHELENFYLEMALVEKCTLNEPVLLINIGGGSTELVVMYNGEPIEKHNLEIGVGTINTQFPTINNEYSKVDLETVVKFIKKNLPKLSNKVRVAFYSGGELNYMSLARYELKNNDLFEDDDHPSIISLENFKKRNNEVYKAVSLKELESLMPDNPTWMHGARGCSAIAQAICKTYDISVIVPSNSDLIHGAIRKEFRSVTLSGSFRKHLVFILKVKKQLEDKHIKILSPRFTEPKNPGEEFVVFSGEEGKTPLELERHHLDSIIKSDALIICDPEGYVGASALIEIGFAQSLGKKIIFMEKPEEFMLNTLPAEIGL